MSGADRNEGARMTEEDRKGHTAGEGQRARPDDEGAGARTPDQDPAASTGDENEWLRITRQDPGHSAWYIERFRSMASRGDDLAGEARLVDAMVPRGARILDAGCGPGRVGAFLAEAGHEVVGVDLDPELIAAADADHPGPLWLVDDLAHLDLPARGIHEGFDAIVCAGNVMTFLAPSTRGRVLARLRAHLREGGRLAVGFGTGRGYALEAFLADAGDAGLRTDLLLSTWSLHPHHDDADFVVALLSPVEADHAPP